MDMAYMYMKHTAKGICSQHRRKTPLKYGGCQQHIHRHSLLALQIWKPQEQHEKLCEIVSITNYHLVSVFFKLQKQLLQICASLTKCRLLHTLSSLASGTGSSLHFIFIIVALSNFSALFFTYSSIINNTYTSKVFHIHHAITQHSSSIYLTIASIPRLRVIRLPPEILSPNDESPG